MRQRDRWKGIRSEAGRPVRHLAGQAAITRGRLVTSPLLLQTGPRRPGQSERRGAAARERGRRALTERGAAAGPSFPRGSGAPRLWGASSEG